MSVVRKWIDYVRPGLLAGLLGVAIMVLGAHQSLAASSCRGVKPGASPAWAAWLTCAPAGPATTGGSVRGGFEVSEAAAPAIARKPSENGGHLASEVNYSKGKDGVGTQFTVALFPKKNLKATKRNYARYRPRNVVVTVQKKKIRLSPYRDLPNVFIYLFEGTAAIPSPDDQSPIDGKLSFTSKVEGRKTLSVKIEYDFPAGVDLIPAE